MSLQAWYPLNGHTNNYGVGDYPVTATNMAYSKEAMSGGDIVWDANHNLFNRLTKYATICFWIYINEATGAHSQNIMIGDDDSGTSRQCAIFTWPTSNDLHIWSLGNNSGSSYNGAFPSYKWTHCALIFRDSTTIVYLNGVKVATLPYIGAAASQPTHVCRTGPTRLIRDLRFYDEALSPKVIKEISKGLMLHIPCNQPDRAKNIIGTSGRIFNYGLNANGGSWSGSVVTDDDCECKKITSTGTNGGFWFDTNGGGWPASDTYNGKTYTWSFEAKCSVNKTLTDVGHERGGIARVDFTTEWKQYKHTWTYASGNNNFVFYGGSWNPGEYILLRNLKIEEGANDNPVYTEGVLDTEYDCSGMGYNMISSRNTPVYIYHPFGRYFCCYGFFGNHSLIGQNKNAIKPTDAITMSIWYMTNTLPTSEQKLFSNFEDGGAGFSAENNGIVFSIYKDKYYTTPITPININTWYHAVGTYDGSNLKLYLNGELKQNIAVTGKIVHNANLNWAIGGNPDNNGTAVSSEFANCYLSDCRIYSTALSAEDVKELYQQSASLTNDGTLLSYDFKEEGAVN